MTETTPEQQAELDRVNAPGLTVLREYLAAGTAVAFLGAGVSRPLYPLWDGLIGQLVGAAADRLDDTEVATLLALAGESPEEVVEIVRQQLGAVGYQSALREVLKVRTDPESGRTWTPVQELICRCPFRAVVTTNYDPGIVDARMRVRPRASATGFMTWQDEMQLDSWRTGDVFGAEELPVLYAHGQHNKVDSVVLATTEYRRAYEGKLSRVLRELMDREHLVWIGFSFADQRIAAILREIGNASGTRIDPGQVPRHVAIMPWDLKSDPGILARRAEISFGAKLVLYPAPDTDYSALPALLTELTDGRHPAAADLSARSEARSKAGIPVKWVPPPDPVEHFTGRAEELARLDRWAADPEVQLIGVTAWGGAGKTTLVTHWVQDLDAAARRSGLRGVFGWSFYADPSTEHWVKELLDWAGRALGVQVSASRPAAAVLALLRTAPLVLVLDGLEVLQEGSAGDGYGRFLSGTLRDVLSGACQQSHSGLILLTSRFAFADMETYDGSSARMLEVPPFTPVEGLALLAAAGADWLRDLERRRLVAAVNGHALAIGVLAALLANRPPTGELDALIEDLTDTARTDARVQRLLKFYADRLSEADRYVLAALALFSRPVKAESVLTVARHAAFNGRLDAWTPAMVETAARNRLGGLISLHPDGKVSAHPLVRDAFRSLALAAAEVAVETSLNGIQKGWVTNRADASTVVEAIELLVCAGEWHAADNLYRSRSRTGNNLDVWQSLPAARLGQRAASAFVGTSTRRTECETQLGLRDYYSGIVGLMATHRGDFIAAREYLLLTADQDRKKKAGDLAGSLYNLSACHEALGEIGTAKAIAAESLSAAGKNYIRIISAQASMGWLAALGGDPAEAEHYFMLADRLQVTFNEGKEHLFSLRGEKWSMWLFRTGRTQAAQMLANRGYANAVVHGLNSDTARYRRLHGRLQLSVGDYEAAAPNFAEAAGCFRDGDYATELAATLIDQADQARAIGDLNTAERHVAEAIGIAAPRKMVLVQADALAARARIFAGQAQLARGRDAADAALRLATRHGLAWHELDALRAHAALDDAEGADNGWAGKADALYARLVPPGLDPDPLWTVERLVAEEKGRGWV